jgi:hypothetical protein
MVDPGLGLGHRSGWSLTRANVRIKIVIIIILKPDSGVALMLGSSHISGWPLTWVNISIKVVIIISFKTQSRDQLEAKPGLWVGLTIDPNQLKNKSNYYHTFKTRLGSQPGA